MPRSWRCTHKANADKIDRHGNIIGTCANCSKRIVWMSVNGSEKVGFWIHSQTDSEQCKPTVATPSVEDVHFTPREITL